MKYLFATFTTLKSQLFAIFALGLLAGPMAAQAPADYDFQQIDHPGTPGTSVFGINDLGDVVGNGDTNTDQFPFVYESRTGTLMDVAPAAGFAGTGVLGITDSGVMVGSVLSGDGSTTSGMIRGKDGTFTFFSHPGAPSFTQARAVNNKGLVSGFRDTSAAGIRAAFIYNPMTDTFTNFVQASLTVAHGINSRGDVVGNAFFFGTDDPCPGFPSASANYGWLRAADGSITFFQVNGQSTRARGINDEGSIVGFVNDSGKIKGFVVKLDGAPCESLTVAGSDLLEFPGLDILFPEGITNSGVIVGSVDLANPHGFIATPQ